MSSWFRISSIAALLVLFALPAEAKERQPSQPEIMYLQAVAAGDIQKARDLAELGHINPANIAGHPLAAHLMSAWWGIPRPALWKDSIFDYVFVELKQDPNAVPDDQERTVFSTFCQNMLGTTPQDTEATFHRTVNRIHVALRLGAKVTEYPAKKHWNREWQPLPACLDTYEMLPENSPLKTEFLQLIDLYLSKGANPNYRYDYGNHARTVPLTVTIRHFDTALLAVLIKHHANPKLTFNVGMSNGCGLGQKRISPVDTLIDDIPEPADRDAPRAEAFLRAFAAVGGDIRTPIFSCKHQTKTLKEMAVDNAQIEYARMAMRLEKEPPTAADAPKLPDGFHDGGHTAHGKVASGQDINSGPPPQPAPGSSGNLDEMTKIIFGRQQSQPFTFTENIHTPSGAVGGIISNTVNPMLVNSCRVRYRTHAHWTLPLLGQQSDHDIDYLIDFTKATRVAVSYQPEPFTNHGPPDSQIRNPAYAQRNVPFLKVWGDNAFCIPAFENYATHCSSASTPMSLRVDLDLKPDEQQRAFALLKKRCPTPAPKLPAAPSPQDGLLALYGFRSMAPITRHFDMFGPEGNVAKQVDIAYVPKIVDGCTVEVTRTQRETYPTHILQDQSSQFTVRYDLSRFASIRLATEPDYEIAGYQADAALGGMTFRQPQQNVLTTYVDGPGARCFVGTTGTSNCSSGEVRVAAIAVPNISMKDIYPAFNRATMPCNGWHGREAANAGKR